MRIWILESKEQRDNESSGVVGAYATKESAQRAANDFSLEGYDIYSLLVIE